MSNNNSIPPIRDFFYRVFIRPRINYVQRGDLRKANITIRLLLALILFLFFALLHMGFSDFNRSVNNSLIFIELLLITAYITARLFNASIGGLIGLIVLCLIPISNILLSKDHSYGMMLSLLIWNVATVLISSTIAQFRTTVIIAVVNMITLLSFAFIPGIGLRQIVVPLTYNIILSLLIIIIMRHKEKMEKDHLAEFSIANLRIQEELDTRKRMEEIIVHNSTHDALTTLPNRLVMQNRLRHVIGMSKRRNEYKYAVLFMDLDHFKSINNSFGHETGDLLLMDTASRLQQCIRDQDLLARFGGDEFIILLEDIDSISEVVKITKRINVALELPFQLKGFTSHPSISIGIVMGAPKYDNPENLIRDAGIAMNRSKENKRGAFEIFDPDMFLFAQERLEIEAGLRKALENDELKVYYQPIHDSRNEKLVSFEALLRWDHPEKGIIPPGDFIPIAEETQLIIPIGYHVIEKVCSKIEQWKRDFPSMDHMTVGINLSNIQCSAPDLLDKLREILSRYNIKSSGIKFELTESLIVENKEKVTKLLSDIRQMGIEILIDDFGTGYSSLSYLNTLPIDILKIDRTFISQMITDQKSTKIVRAIIGLAHNLEMRVIAEGVETEDQLRMLSKMHADFIQGYCYSPPVDAKRATEMLQFLENQATGVKKATI